MREVVGVRRRATNENNLLCLVEVCNVAVVIYTPSEIPRACTEPRSAAY